MNSLLEKFLRLPLFYRAGIGFLCVFAFFFIGQVYIIGPVSQERVAIEDSISDLEIAITKEKTLAKKKPEFEKEVSALDQRLRRILLELPDQKEIDAFLRSISVLAVDTGLEVVKFSPRNEIPREFFYELPVQIELMGTFHQLVTFFDELSRLTGIVNITNIGIKIVRREGKQTVISVVCQATTYRYDESSREIVVAAPDGKGKRRR